MNKSRGITSLINKSFYEILIILLIAAALFVGLRLTIQTYIVNGPIMEPNYWQNEWIIINKLAYKIKAPHRGDIIVFQPPISSTKPFIKRIIGLPGETVEIKDATVYVHKTDGDIITLQEPYIKEPFFTNYTGIIIPENEYFVMGDNRNNSSDSRYGWLVSRDKIRGQAWISVWPPSLWGLADNYTQPPLLPGTAQQITFN
jgi:signal peptidase I